MKVNINKLADGGGFATFTPIFHNSGTQQISRQQTTSEQPASQLLDEKLLEDLYKQGGLVNDVNALISEIAKLENSSDMPFMKRDNRMAVLNIRKKMNEIRETKQYWEDTISRAKDSGGLAEVAIDTYGRVFTKTSDNKIVALSLKEYSQKKDKIKPLTVQELMYERQYNESLTNQNAVFSVAENAIGINKITSQIKDLIKTLAISEDETTRFYSKQQVSAYLQQVGAKNPNQSEIEGLKIMAEILETPGDFVEVTSKVRTQKNHLEKALNYIWNTLGEPAQQKLTVTAIMSDVANPKQLIWDMLESDTLHSTSNSIIPKAPPETLESKAAKDNKDKNISLSPQELFYADKFYRPGLTYEINNPAAGVTMHVTAGGIGPLFSLQKNGEVIGPTTVSKVFTNENYQSILDPSKIFIGDQRIDPILMREMAYTGEQVGKVYLPVNPDGSPNLALMNKFNEAYQMFSMNKDTWTKEEAQRFFKNSGFDGVQIKELNDGAGNLTKVIAESGRVRPFLALPIMTNSASDLSDNPWMVKLTGDKRKIAEVLLDEAFTTYAGTASKPKVIKTLPSSLWSWEIPYKGVLFAALTPESNAVISSTQGHLYGKAPSETDLYRNLNHSAGLTSPVGVEASARLLQ